MDITCNIYIIYFNINITLYTLLLFHKYHRIPHVVTGSVTLTNSEKNLCENSLQTFSKHTAEWWLFHSGHEKKFTYGRFTCHMTGEAVFSFCRKFTFTYINYQNICSDHFSWLFISAHKQEKELPQKYYGTSSKAYSSAIIYL